ncbi:MAG: polyphosphate kinase 1 [Planctomycetia bacterium]|nr:polyphosphate kinase 1 [Planctomycetia bacterium]
MSENIRAIQNEVQTRLDDPSLYINRELSWLEFNRRVLEEAADPSVPLLERLKFISIFSSNLEEFFMVRVGGLHQKLQAGINVSNAADRIPPRELIQRINLLVQELTAQQYHLLNNEILPPLAKAGIQLLEVEELTSEDTSYLRSFFNKQILPVLTPLAIDPGHPFPHLSNKTLNLAVMLKRSNQSEPLFAVVQVPAVLQRFVPLPTRSGHCFVPLERVIRMHLPEIFLGMDLMASTVFQVIRNREYEIDDEVEDLLKTMEEELRKRRRGAAVHVYLKNTASIPLVEFLTSSFDLEAEDITHVPSMLDLTGLNQLYALPGYDQLRDAAYVPRQVAEFEQAPSQWAAIRSRDILVHHPYESFHYVLDFIKNAARDEQVLAIKQTLYRAGADSPIIRALQEAADNGKQVTVLVELKARMDEERNILWARELEKAGVHVVFGFVNMKTHCKVCLVVRKEEDGLRRYVHLSTGNYNPQTSRIYTDFGFFTCNEDFGEDSTALFNYLTGYSNVPNWRKLILAPSRLLNFILEKIEKEIDNQKKHKNGRIISKINGLLEPTLVKALYQASQAGVQIDIICRGICSLRPGIKGISDNIRVRSIVDRFLEHSRVFYFGNNNNPEVYIGSADWMDRNLSRRVEVVFPIEHPVLKKRMIDEILAVTLADNVKARELRPDGSWIRVTCDPQKRVRSQSRFLELAAEAASRISSEPGILVPIPVPELQTIPVQQRRRKITGENQRRDSSKPTGS